MKVMRKYVKHHKNLDFSNVIRKRGFMKKILLSLAALFLFNASANAATTIIENYDATKLKQDIIGIYALKGAVIESNKHSIMEETYLDTELINKSKAEDKVLKEKLRQLQEVLGVNEEQAKILLQQTQLNKTHLGRPDLLYKSKKRRIRTRPKKV